jgi:hypothetical protein
MRNNTVRNKMLNAQSRLICFLKTRREVPGFVMTIFKPFYVFCGSSVNLFEHRAARYCSPLHKRTRILPSAQQEWIWKACQSQHRARSFSEQDLREQKRCPAALASLVSRRLDSESIREAVCCSRRSLRVGHCRTRFRIRLWNFDRQARLLVLLRRLQNC